MSRWSPEPLRVLLARDRLALARGREAPLRWQGGDAGDSGPTAAAPWSAVADAFAAIVTQARAERAWPARASLRVVLSGQFTRHCILPWNDAFTSPVQRDAWARYCFEEVHGARARAWSVRISEDRYGVAAVAAAVDSALLDRIGAIATAAGLRLDSVQPALMAAFNQRAAGPDVADGWFVAAEPGHRSLLLMRAGAPMRVVSDGGDEDLARVIAREWLTAGFDGPVGATRQFGATDGGDAGLDAYLDALA